jgi:acetoin utilization deacetylase AcuC-like enzyme
MLNGQPFTSTELPQRADMILDTLRRHNIGEIHTPRDYGIAPIATIHDAGFLDYLQNIFMMNNRQYHTQAPVYPDLFRPMSARLAPQHIDGLKGQYCYGMDSPILAGTWQAAYWSAQCAISAAMSLSTGQRSAYALCRPPGHHAARDLYGGFCYLNNAAIAAQTLGSHVAILDIDYHHGNGTQELFYNTADVLFCSLHADPRDEYPYYWGSQAEIGEGPGTGFNYNWPLPKNATEEMYIPALQEALEVINRYSPVYLIVSVGFDLLKDDPVGGFQLTLDSLHRVSQAIYDLKLPTAIIQEGGYNLENIGTCAEIFLSPFTNRL